MHAFILSSAVVGLASYAFAQTVSERIASHIRAEDLKADVAYLASDALQGRATPSPGLETAAEYIASQMRKAGLEPVGDDNYFQTGTYRSITPDPEGLAFSLGPATSAGSIALFRGGPLDLTGAPAFKTKPAELGSLTADQVKGRVLVVDAVVPPGSPLVPWDLSMALKLDLPLVVIILSERPPFPMGPILREVSMTPDKTAVLIAWGEPLRQLVASATSGPMSATVSTRIAAPRTMIVKLRNVAGLLRGSDPQLKDTYIVVSAHYDHLGSSGTGQADRVFNGANDNASGASSLIEIGAALAALSERPKRSILFLAVFGGANGLYGSRHYTRHPIFPLARTVADLNLEMLGRTDDMEGPTPRQLYVNGFDYTDIAPIMAQAGAVTGIKVVKHAVKTESSFDRSDNITFAEAGVPATMVSTTYEYPDLHTPGDEWTKLDYENMAQVDRCIGLALWDMANTDKAPQWNRKNARTARFVQAFDNLGDQP